jgi:outer membrane protein insertion porin family
MRSRSRRPRARQQGRSLAQARRAEPQPADVRRRRVAVRRLLRQLAFQTSNFLGRGETFTISAQAGNRAKNYQLAFTEPFLFDKPMTAGVDLFIREIRWPGQFTQASDGGNLVYGFQTGDFSRMFLNYSLEQVKVKDLNPLYTIRW